MKINLGEKRKTEDYRREPQGSVQASVPSRESALGSVANTIVL